MSRALEGHQKTMLWNLFFHGIAFVLTLISGVVMVPLYLRHISASEYGYWLATGNILVWMSAADPGFADILLQRIGFWSGRNDKDRVGVTIVCGLSLSFLLGAFVAVAGGILGHYLGRFIPGAHGAEWSGVREAYLWALAGTCLMLTSFSVTGINQGLQGSLGPGVIYTAANVVSIVLGTYWIKSDAGVRALGWMVLVRGGMLLAGNLLYLFWRVRRDAIPLRNEVGGYREILGLGGISFLGRLPVMVGSNLDAYVSASLIGPASTVGLNLTRKGYDLARMIAERPAIALLPAVSHAKGEGLHVQTTALLLRLWRWSVWALGLLVAGFLCLNRYFVDLWVGQGIYTGTLINVLLCASMVLGVLITNLSTMCYAFGDIRGNSLISLVSGLLMIVAVFVGGALWGLVGLVAASVLINVFVSVPYYCRQMVRLMELSRNEIRIAIREAVVAFAVAAVVVLAGTFLSPVHWGSFMLCAAGMTCLYALLLALVSVHFRVEFSDLVTMLRNKFLL